MKGLKKHVLDFEILDTNNNKTIVFLDSSQYYDNPTTPILELMGPGLSSRSILNVEFDKLNVFNSHSLRLTDYLAGDDCSIIQDGIWQATYRICPYNELYITKHFVKADTLNECLFKIYSKFDVECCDDNNEKIKKQLLDITILLESAKANAYLNYVDKAKKDFQLASKKVNKLLNFVQ